MATKKKAAKKNTGNGNCHGKVLADGSAFMKAKVAKVPAKPPLEEDEVEVVRIRPEQVQRPIPKLSPHHAPLATDTTSPSRKLPKPAPPTVVPPPRKLQAPAPAPVPQKSTQAGPGTIHIPERERSLHNSKPGPQRPQADFAQLMQQCDDAIATYKTNTQNDVRSLLFIRTALLNRNLHEISFVDCGRNGNTPNTRFRITITHKATKEEQTLPLAPDKFIILFFVRAR